MKILDLIERKVDTIFILQLQAQGYTNEWIAVRYGYSREYIEECSVDY